MAEVHAHSAWMPPKQGRHASAPLMQRPSFASTCSPNAQAFRTPTPSAWSASTFCKPGSLGESPSAPWARGAWHSLHVRFFVVLEALLAGCSDDQYGSLFTSCVFRFRGVHSNHSERSVLGPAVCVVKCQATQRARNSTKLVMEHCADDGGDSIYGGDGRDRQRGRRWLQAARF